MRIDEITNPAIKAKTAFSTKDAEFINSGYQAQVYQHPRDPNKVIKLVDMDDPNDDSYIDFIKLAMAHQDNPHFPRIFGAKVYEKHDDDKHEESEFQEESMGDYRLVVVMEKLYSVRTHKLEKAAIAAFENIGIPNRIAAASINKPSLLQDYIEDYYDDTMARVSSHVDKFIEAYKLLQPYIDEYGQDMHSKNFMLRITSTGPVLVLVDPLSPTAFM